MADAFKLGDVVALKSGGVAMTVVEVWECDKQGWAIVAWDVSGEVNRETFPVEALEYDVSPVWEGRSDSGYVETYNKLRREMVEQDASA